MDADIAFHASSALEKVLEHRFVAELTAALWLRGAADFEVLRAEVDSHGYDVVVEANGITRHIQLKALRQGGKRSEVTLSTRLARKPSGCVVWMVYDPATLALGPFLWFGGTPGQPLPGLGEKIGRHTKGDAGGKKTARPAHRIVKKSAFETTGSMAELVETLFGPAPAPTGMPTSAPGISTPEAARGVKHRRPSACSGAADPQERTRRVATPGCHL